MYTRSSGVLLHITSLPGPYGIGTLGDAARRFVHFLKETKQTYWQILPLTTTSYGDSPYQSFSSNAGNTLLIDLDTLIQEGLLTQEEVSAVFWGDNAEKVDYATLFLSKRTVLNQAVSRFVVDAEKLAALQQFEHAQPWLQDYAEFMAIKEHFNYVALHLWDDKQAIERDSERLAYYRQNLSETILYYKVTQYFFFTQWQALKAYANEQGIRIIGDLPIYVSADSVEVWTMPHLFKLDDNKEPLFIAGCPPDGFSEDGQLWGNPIYNWSVHHETNYAWWVDRIQHNFKLYDVLRIDHFKGFSDYWEIKAGDTTAKFGSWQEGPGYALFAEVKRQLGDVPIIAEDLGNIDDKTRALLQACGYPGMKVLEFGFYDVEGKSIDSPHRTIPHSVAYVGTHDNEVANGWYENLDDAQKDYVNKYTHRHDNELITQTMLRVLFATTSNIAIATMQDILDKDADSRMNRPSTVGGNWEWRMLDTDITPDKKNFLHYITTLYQRSTD